jgi:hypothetical protein
LANYKKDLRKWQAGQSKYITSFLMLEQRDCYMGLVELYPCNSQDELYAQEQFYTDAHNSKCINKNKVYTRMTLEEYLLLILPDIEHKEQITKMKAKYKAKYKNQVYEENARYCGNYKQEISEKNAKYHQENKECINQQKN